MTRLNRLAAGTVIGFWMSLLPAAAAPPQIVRITPPALQSGATATIVVEGTELLPNPLIVLPVPIASQTVKAPAAANRVQIEVKLADNVPPGVYLLRIGNDKGISNPLAVEIDDAPQMPFGPQIAKLPAAVQGALSGSATLSTAFEGKKGQRFGDRGRGAANWVHHRSGHQAARSERVQLAWAQGSNFLGGDTRLTSVLPADGTYTIELHDAQYRAGSPNRFRLRVGDFQYADLAFPWPDSAERRRRSS